MNQLAYFNLPPGPVKTKNEAGQGTRAQSGKKHRNVLFPQTVGQFAAQWSDFQKWLKAKGSEILTPAGYEVAKFSVPGGVGVVFRNVNDTISPNHWTGGSASAFIAWKTADKNWRIGAKVPKLWSDDRRALTLEVAKRDGWRCCYCPEMLTIDTATLEHFVPKTCGGTNHLANVGLACFTCNREVGHKSVAEKMRFGQRRLAKARAAFALAGGTAMWRAMAEKHRDAPCTTGARIKNAAVALWRRVRP